MNIALDIETRCLTDLIKHGVDQYRVDPSLEIYTFAYQIDDGPVLAWRTGEPFPIQLRACLYDDYTLTGWNVAEFDVPVWNAAAGKNGWPTLDLARVEDTMDLSRMAGGPGKLDHAGAFWGTRIRKDAEGHALMLAWCGHTDPMPNAVLHRLAAYCRDDVATEGLIAARVPRWPTDPDRDARRVSRLINERGFALDVPLVRAAAAMRQREAEASQRRLARLTGGEVESITKVAALQRWCNDRLAPEDWLWDMRAATVDAVLDRPIAPEVREALTARRDGGRTSARKFDAAADRVGPDGRLRWQYVYYGAPATGRWSGRGFQPHNLPRDCYADVEPVRAAVLAGDAEVFDDVVRGLSRLLRPSIVAPPGKVLVAIDWSAVEARCLAWEAGDDAKLALFAAGDDVYQDAARAIFPGEIGDFERLVGKVSELACGYGGSEGAFTSMAGNYGVHVPAGDVRRIVQAWRRKNRAIVELWRWFDHALPRLLSGRYQGAPECLARLGVTYAVGDGALLCRLPSGRVMRYPDAQIDEHGQVTYARGAWAPARGASSWPRAKLWGGLLTENLTQAIARDLLAAAMVRLEAMGYPVVLHVHDEIVCEVPAGVSEKLADVMREPPAWAKGLPLEVKDRECERFGK
jgi:DNA polymerase